MNNTKFIIRCISALLLFIIITPTSSSAQEPAAKESKTNVIHQLRIYEIFDGNKKAFHDRFRDHALRIMKKYDFKIVSIWESKKDNRTEFIYLLEWPDKETMNDRWAKFRADKEWSDIKKQTAAASGQLVGEIQERELVLTGYSPQRHLLKQ